MSSEWAAGKCTCQQDSTSVIPCVLHQPRGFPSTTTASTSTDLPFPNDNPTNANSGYLTTDPIVIEIPRSRTPSATVGPVPVRSLRPSQSIEICELPPQPFLTVDRARSQSDLGSTSDHEHEDDHDVEEPNDNGSDLDYGDGISNPSPRYEAYEASPSIANYPPLPESRPYSRSTGHNIHPPPSLRSVGTNPDNANRIRSRRATQSRSRTYVGGRDGDEKSVRDQDRDSKRYQPPNPFQMSVTEFAKLRGEQRLEDLRDSTTHLGGGGGGNQDTPPTGSGGGESSTSTDSNSGTALDDLPIKTTVTDFIKALLVDVIAFQVYHALMLRLPGLYWVRIIRLFEHAEKSLPDVAILLAGPHPHDSDTGMTSIGGSDMTATAHHGRVHEIPVGMRARPFRFRTGTTYTLSNLDRKQEPLSYKKMKDSWNNFIEALLSEWATFNILTVLLLSAIIAILQIDAAAQDIIIRTSALISLVFAFLSLLFGCIYIGRFHEMRKPYKGAHWAWQVAKIRGTNLFWNAWVFLAMPAVFLAWSLVAFIICMLAYVWRTGDPTQDAPPPFTKQALLGSRIAVTAVLGIGCIYLIFGGMKFREYEAMYQESTHRIIKQWLEQNPQLDGEDEDDSLGEGEEVKDLQLMRVNDVRLTTSPSPWQSEQYLGDSDASDIEHHPNHPYSGHQATTGDNRQVRFEHRHPGGADPPKSILKSQLRPSVPITNTPRPSARPSEKAASAGILIQVVPPPLTGVGIKKPGASKPLDPANSKLISRNFKDALFSTPSRPIMPPTPVSPGWLKIAALVRFQLLRHPIADPVGVGSLRGVGLSYS